MSASTDTRFPPIAPGSSPRAPLKAKGAIASFREEQSSRPMTPSNRGPSAARASAESASRPGSKHQHRPHGGAHRATPAAHGHSPRVPTRPESPKVMSPSPASRYRSIARTLSDPHERDRRAALVRTAIIFDWDDTLLPTTWLQSRRVDLNAKVLPQDIKKSMRAIEAQAIAVLSTAMKLGVVTIITNAEAGWVEQSARQFMPAVTPLLQNIRIISARTSYENAFTGAGPSLWKTYAFRHLLGFLFKGYTGRRQVVSIGDGEFERAALLTTTDRAFNTLGKSVKLYEHPNDTLLRKSLHMVLDNLVQIVTAPKALDIMLTTDPTAPDVLADGKKPGPAPAAPAQAAMEGVAAP